MCFPASSGPRCVDTRDGGVSLDGDQVLPHPGLPLGGFFPGRPTNKEQGGLGLTAQGLGALPQDIQECLSHRQIVASGGSPCHDLGSKHPNKALGLGMGVFLRSTPPTGARTPDRGLSGLSWDRSAFHSPAGP